MTFQTIQNAVDSQLMQSLNAETQQRVLDVLSQLNTEYVPTETPLRHVVQKCAENFDSEDPFYVVDLGVLVSQFLQWKTLLPRVEPHYAVKCNNSQPLLSVLNALGAGFDCASQVEIESVMSLGMTADRIIFANPCKQKSHIKHAATRGIKMVTFDNEDELHKIKAGWPNAEVVLRIITDDSKSICQFSTKFGARLDDCPALIALAKKLDLNLVGVSFHVGSGCLSTESFVKAVESARWVFDEAESQGLQLSLLDVGGGFPGTKDTLPFEDIAAALGPAIDKMFPSHVRVIAEPGRYFAAATHALACNLFSKRTINNTDGDKEFLYYINDGVYGSFNCIFFDHVDPEVDTLVSRRPDEKQYLSSVFGPTCDALDCIAKRKLLPELDIGDWLYFPNFGAYTVAAASAFNGFTTAKIHYIFRDNATDQLQR